MFSSFIHTVALVLVILISFTYSQSPGEPGYGYNGYALNQHGDPADVLYATADTPPPVNISALDPEPDVFLNASVNVGIIELTVDNITAKVNLDAQVLQLLKFNAGVDASIDRVRLTILNVSAEVLLEARLGNIVLMVNDVLKSLDLNPILATLGRDLNHIVNNTVGVITGSPRNSGGRNSGAAPKGMNNVAKRQLPPQSYQLANNILYSVNDYSGHTHTNRVLAQNGSIMDYSLDDNGHTYRTEIVGDYLHDMKFNGHNVTVTRHRDPRAAYELEYLYHPFPGITCISAIYLDVRGTVVATQVISESNAGGMSTLGEKHPNT